MRGIHSLRSAFPRQPFFIGFAMIVALAPWAVARMMAPSSEPVERLIQNLGAKVKESPQDSELHYLLGRVHSLAFATEARSLRFYLDRTAPNGGLPRFVSLAEQGSAARFDKEGKSLQYLPAERAEHLAGAVDHLTRAIELNTYPARYHLGLAYVLDQGADSALTIDSAAALHLVAPDASKTPSLGDEYAHIDGWVRDLESTDAATSERAMKSLRDHLDRAVFSLNGCRTNPSTIVRKRAAELMSEAWRERAIAEYYRAHDDAILADLPTQAPLFESERGKDLANLISFEAGEAYMRLVRARGARNADESARIATIEEHLKRLREREPQKWVSPILFSLDEARPLEDLLAPETHVTFDLDGFGRGDSWTWIKPSTGLLVWDPDHQGRITSGRQLFGSVTWWMFFRDGYRALDALDNDRDGWIAGEELRGLSVWFDRNSDGISQAGEVVPIECLGVRAISCRSTSVEGISPANVHGLLLEDGRVLPTYDWMAESSPVMRTDTVRP